MEIKSILQQSRDMWGDQRLNLSEIIVRMGKVFGDICRWERGAKKDIDTHTDDELKKELGNMIVCNIRWCDDLGYDPEECIRLAFESQKNFEK